MFTIIFIFYHSATYLPVISDAMGHDGMVAW